MENIWRCAWKPVQAVSENRTQSNGEDVIRHGKAPSHSLRARTQTNFPLTQSTDFSLISVSSWQTDEVDKADTDIPIFYTQAEILQS